MGRAAQRTTKLTSRPGTTIVFATSFPSTQAATEARAAALIADTYRLQGLAASSAEEGDE